MKHAKPIIVIGLMIIFGAIGVLLTQTNKQAPNQKPPIKIGATLALTGSLSYIGESEKHGMEMAIEEINTNQGINNRILQLVIEDNQGDVKMAAHTVQKLLAVDNVSVLFSAFTHVTKAIRDIAAQQNAVLMYASSVNDIAQSDQFFFKDYYDIVQQGKTMGDVVVNDAKRRIAFFTEIHEACQQYESAFTEAVGQHGISIAKKESYQSTETSFKTQLTRLKNTNIDAIVACTWRHEHIFMKELKELGMIHIPTYHITAPFLPAADTTEMRAIFSENKSISTWYGLSPNTSHTKQIEFIRKYRTKYGDDPRPDAAYAYDDMYAIAGALKVCDKQNDITSPCIARELAKTNLDGAGGHLSFDEHRASKRPVVLLQAENNEWKEIPMPTE